MIALGLNKWDRGRKESIPSPSLPSTPSSLALLYHRAATQASHLRLIHTFLRRVLVTACAPLPSMPESPRYPNPGLNGYQQDAMHAEVRSLSLPVALQTFSASAALPPQP